VEGTLVYPSLQGATNWFSPSYSPQAKLFYVSVREMGSYFYKGEAVYKPGTLFTGGSERTLNGDLAWGAVRALNPDTGQQVWEFRLKSPPWAGLLSTMGGLVFGGSSEGNFFALDALTGAPLWDFQTGSSMESNPISFSIDGRQCIAVASGRAVFVFAL
jgi:alcohol dehydrogenase (cytochrome c)